MSLRDCRRFLACYGFNSILETTSHTPDMPICEPSFHGDSAPLNQIFFSQCIQDSDEERSFYSQQKNNVEKRSLLVQCKINKSNECNSTHDFKRNIKRSISDQPNIKTSDVYDVSLYEGRLRIDEDKSCLEPDVHMSDELNSAVEQENNLHLKQSAIKYKKYTTNKSDSSDSSDDYEVAAKKKKNQKSKNNLHLKQSAIKYKKYTTIKSDSSDSSDDYEVAAKKKKNQKSKTSEKNVKNSNPKNNLHLKQSAIKYKKYTTNKSDSSDSSDDYEVAAKKKKNQKSKTSEKNVKNSKPKNNMQLKQSAVKYMKYTSNKNDSSEEREMASSDDWEVSFSDEQEMPTSDEWEMPPSDESEMHSSDEWETPSNTSNDYYESSDSSDDSEDSVNKVKNKKPDIGKLSEYEKMVQKNRDEKIAFLQSLKMDEVKEGLNEAIRNLKPKRLPRKSNIESSKSVSTAQGPARKSVRLAKVDINLSEEALEARALAGAKEIKKELPPILTFEEAIARNNVYTDFVRDFDDLDFKTPEPFTDYVSCFKNMKIDKSKIAKVVNGKLTAMALHPTKEKVIVSAGNKYGAVGFCHVTSDSVPYVFEPHLLAVSCLKFNADSQNQIISCSDDGTMRCGDMEKRVFNEVFNISEETSCNYFDFISPSTTVVCHRNGNVSLVDIRSHRKYAEKSHKCHESPVKTVSVHPVNKNYFVSADIKGFLSLWDLRKLRKKPVLEVHPQRTVITSAFFSPVTGNSILTFSPADYSLCLFDCSKLGSDLKLYRKVRLICNSNRVPIFKATWLPNTDDAFVIGSLEYPRRIEIFNNQLDNIYNFQDEYLDTFPITNVFHPSLPVLAGGNSNGKVYIFS